MSPLELELAEGLSVRFDTGEPFQRHASNYLGHLQRSSSSEGRVLEISSGSRPRSGARGERVLLEEGLEIRVAGASLVFERGGIVGWCDGATGRGGVAVGAASESAIREFVNLALAPMLFELAEPLGWLGIHAAAVSVNAFGILLPGPSGVGKSTIFRSCHAAGLDLLSDDLVWLREEGEGSFRMYPFPRGFDGGGHDTAPLPTVSTAPVNAIVCPEIVERTASRVHPLEPGSALDVLLDQSGFLGWRSRAGRRFRSLVRLAGAVPCHGLEAGSRRKEVPDLLRRLAVPDFAFG